MRGCSRDRAFAAGELRDGRDRFCSPRSGCPVRSVHGRSAGEAKAHPCHLTGLRVGLYEERVTRFVDELPIDRCDGEQRPGTNRPSPRCRTTSSAHPEQTGVDRLPTPARAAYRNVASAIARRRCPSVSSSRSPNPDTPCPRRANARCRRCFERLLRMGPQPPASATRARGRRTPRPRSRGPWAVPTPARSTPRSARRRWRLRARPSAMPAAAPCGAQSSRTGSRPVDTRAVEAPAMERAEAMPIVGDGTADGDVAHPDAGGTRRVRCRMPGAAADEQTSRLPK